MPIDVQVFYETYGPMVLRRCQGLLRNDHDALDAMQEVFVKVLDRQATLEGYAPSSLLYRIATNVCLNRLRTRRRRPEDTDDSALQDIIAACDPEATSWVHRLLGKIFAREEASTQVIAVLHWVDGLTLEEVAAEVGLSVSGVRKRLRGLKQRASLAV